MASVAVPLGEAGRNPARMTGAVVASNPYDLFESFLGMDVIHFSSAGSSLGLVQ